MNINFQKLISGLILTLGMIFFLFVVIAKEFMFSVIIAAFTLISWILYQVLIDKQINYKQIGNVIFLAGLIIGAAVFFVFGVEQVAFPAGSIKFKATGIARSLGIILFSMIPALMFYIVEDTLPKISIKKEKKQKQALQQRQTPPEKEETNKIKDYNEDDWEEANEEDLLEEYEIA